MEFLKTIKGVLYVILIFLVMGAVTVWVAFSSPQSFESGTVFSVVPGSSVQLVAGNLKTENIIRSSKLFQMILIMQSLEGSVVAGDYLFDNPVPLLHVVERITLGDFGMPQQSITIPEGYTVSQIGELVEEKGIGTQKEFITLAQQYEGYLFPDTYRIHANMKIPELIERMRNQFNRKIEPLLSDIHDSDKTLDDIVIMASLIEREAITDAERPVVSGILWNRIRIGMPLQVDAPFLVYLGKTSSQLTLDDLRRPAPYNTYVNRGLPPTPIANPGLASLRAALYPEETSYLFYLHGKNGKIHYGRTHNDHIRNRNLYLR
jgi:UPF0755 protein